MLWGNWMAETNRVAARLACLSECLDALYSGQSLPAALCYQPCRVPYRLSRQTEQLDTKKIVMESCPSFESDSDVLWIEEEDEEEEEMKMEDTGKLVAIESIDGNLFHLPISIPIRLNELIPVNDLIDPSTDCPYTFCWQEAIDLAFSNGAMHCRLRSSLLPSSDRSSALLAEKPSSDWSLAHDKAIIELVSENSLSNNEAARSETWALAEEIELSSSIDYHEVGVRNLTDGDPNTYWESDKSDTLPHSITVKLKPNALVGQITISIDPADLTYLPRLIHVYGLAEEGHVLLQETTIASLFDVIVLSSNTRIWRQLHITIAECRDQGVDCRIRALRLYSHFSPNRSKFQLDLSHLYSSPILQGIDRKCLSRRVEVISRLASLYDYVLPWLVPGNSSLTEKSKILLPLSSRRQSLLKMRVNSDIGEFTVPKLFLDRWSSMPLLDQVFDELRRIGIPPQFRRNTDSGEMEQWWECVFLGEGVIDQGGGFRDSLCDMADQLTPLTGSPKSDIFRRCEDDSSLFELNPEYRCEERLEFLGQLMGACSRSRELMALSLHSKLWDQLVESRLQRGKRMDQRIAALRLGLETVLGKVALQLHFGQSLEMSVCGKADIQVADIRNASHLEELRSDEPRVRHLWNALTSFSNRDRSAFLRFVCGRSRLPAQLYICAEKKEGMTDCLPESSTCSNTLYLPEYSRFINGRRRVSFKCRGVCLQIALRHSPLHGN